MFKYSAAIPAIAYALHGTRISHAAAATTTKRNSSVGRSARSMPQSLENKVVLITGATAGIGRATACRFAEEGSKLILIGRRENILKELKKDIEDAYKVDVHTVAMSVTDFDAISALPSKLPAKFAEVDILVNNAGLALGVTSVEENSVADAKTVIDTNVLGVIAFCRAFIPGMLERGRGHVINIGSVAGHFAYTKGTVYNASKFAVNGFTMAATHDLIATPLRMTQISPGLVGNTEFSNVRLGDDTKAAAVYQDLEALDPEDVADNVIYAVS